MFSHPLIRLSGDPVQDALFAGVLSESGLVCKCGAQPTVTLPAPDGDSEVMHVCAECANSIVY